MSSALCFAMLSGCARFHHEQVEHVYVSARKVYLRDRVAAVSNRVAEVTNGEELLVVEHGKRFTKVRTPKGEVGWLEDHSIIDDKLYGQFEELKKKHAADPAVATGTLRDDLYLHITPGRETLHFLVLPANTKLQMLERGMVARPLPPGTPAPTSDSNADHSEQAAPVPMEDWWLVRDPSGNCGWLIARQVDVEVPDEIGGYAEGQRIIGAYPIAKVMDSGVERIRRTHKKGEKVQVIDSSDDTAPAPTPTEHTEYVTVLAPPRGGLSYDFDQVRVFTWSLNHHRYETAFRLHGIRGYLPVRLGKEMVSGQADPTFTFDISDGPDVKVDADTGVSRPANPRTIAFRLEGNLVRRTGADLGPIVLVHEDGRPVSAKEKAKKKKP